MISNHAFDLWADGYDQDVALSDQNDTYPFAGYRDVLNTIYNQVRRKDHARILDIGFGTGTLTARLYRDGYEIAGIDFSERMVALAREKMPDAALYLHDFARGLPESLNSQTFDFIVSTYAIHHLTDAEKPGFIRTLLEHLSPGGSVLLGDVAFSNRQELEACRAASGDEWDDEEFYIVFDAFRQQFPDAEFQKLSACAGVLQLTKPQ